MKRILLFTLFLATSACAVRRPIGPDYAMPIEQRAGADRVGWSAVIIGRGVVAGPRYRNWNVVTVDTGPYRYQWQELRENGRLVFTINERFKFWRYKNLFLVVDSEGTTHKFELVAAEKIQP
jgi:hypothetical protein